MENGGDGSGESQSQVLHRLRGCAGVVGGLLSGRVVLHGSEEGVFEKKNRGKAIVMV